MANRLYFNPHWQRTKLFIRYYLLFLLYIPGSDVISQTIGGSSAFNFLNLPVSAQTSALGGLNISNQSNDLSLVYGNPALLRDTMNSQMAADFNVMYAGIKNYFLSVAYNDLKLHTNFAAAINFIDYGNNSRTDPAGNIQGNFSAYDYCIQLSASGKYEKNWYYGTSLKFINSSYAQYKSNALAFDIGINYRDISRLWEFGLVAKNMGTQVKSYALEKEDIPFDIELAVSKKLATIPIQISLTIHHLHQFDIRYNDTLFHASTAGSLDKILQHFIFAAQYLIGNKIELTAGYNYLRRNELKITTAGNGWTGLSFGVGALFSKLQVHYARSYYQNTTAYNQLGINFNLKRSSF